MVHLLKIINNNFNFVLKATFSFHTFIRKFSLRLTSLLIFDVSRHNNSPPNNQLYELRFPSGIYWYSRLIHLCVI